MSRQRPPHPMTERFTLLSELGRGSMGVVWKARDEESGSIVALKLLRETYAEDPDYVTRFERELELAKRIHSRNVVQVLGYGVRDKVPYLALEYVDGPSLRERLASHGPYAWPEAKALLAQIAQGLADAHAAGVVHRDLKPSNILIGSDGVPKIADFGIAKGLDLTRVTGTSTLLGTPAYLAPEGPADERSDLYSLGVIAYELLTGVVPFEGRTYQEVILRHVREAPDLEKLQAEARPIVGWLLAKDAAERPQSAHDLLPVLWGQGNIPAQTQPPAPVVASTGSTWTVPPSAVPPVAGYPFGPRRSRRHRTTLVAGASVALVLTFGAAATLLVLRPGGANPPSYSAPTPSTIASAGSPSFSPSSGSITFTPSPSQAASPLVPSGAYYLDAETTWADTGIAVQAGDRITLAAVGTYGVIGTDQGKTPSSVGCGGQDRSNLMAAPDLSFWSVVGRIGYGTPFCIGGGCQITAVTSGELYATINDNYFVDNWGGVIINWQISHQP